MVLGRTKSDVRICRFVTSIQMSHPITHHRSQEQISRLAKEVPTPVKVPPSTMPVTERKVSLLATGGHKKNDPNRRYTIIKQDGSETERPRFPTSPYAARAPKFCNDSISDAVSLSQSPKVMSHKDLPQKEMGFKMYDVILSGEGDAPAPTFDPEMEKFMPMLTDYL